MNECQGILVLVSSVISSCMHDLVLGLYFLFYVYASLGRQFLDFVLLTGVLCSWWCLCSNHFKCSSLCSGIIHQHGLILARLVHFSQWQLTRSSEIGTCLELMKNLWSFYLKLSCSNVRATWILMEGAMPFVSVSNSWLYFHSISLKSCMFFFGRWSFCSWFFLSLEMTGLCCSGATARSAG